MANPAYVMLTMTKEAALELFGYEATVGMVNIPVWDGLAWEPPYWEFTNEMVEDWVEVDVGPTPRTPHKRDIDKYDYLLED